MKLTLTILFCALFLNAFANYSTPGTGRSWNLDSLVMNSNGEVTFSSGSYVFSDTLTISQSDTVKVVTNSVLKFGSMVFIDIFGTLIINPADSVKITALDTTQKFLGLKFEEFSDASIMRKMIFEYGNGIRLLDCDMLIDNCIIRFNTLNSSFSSSAINLFRSNAVISNNKIFRNRRSAIASGANIASSPQIINNLIYENDTENANVPQINFGATGSAPLIIRGNTITGLFDNSGGISLLPVGSIPLAIIENNIIRKNRYGIAVAGNNSNVYINNNTIDSNNIQGIPNLGGSGINFNGGSTQISVVSRNKIRGNLWGITIQGTAKPTFGNLSSPDTANVGMNEIYYNGNSGKTFDLFNNTPDSIKAENNYWGTDNIDTVEAHIFHMPDSSVLGYVDFLPIRILTGMSHHEVFAVQSFKLYDAYPNPFNPSATIEFMIPVSPAGTPAKLIVYDIIGRKVSTLIDENLNGGSYRIKFDAAGLSGGIYYYTLRAGDFTETKKMLLLK